MTNNEHKLNLTLEATPSNRSFLKFNENVKNNLLAEKKMLVIFLYVLDENGNPINQQLQDLELFLDIDGQSSKCPLTYVAGNKYESPAMEFDKPAKLIAQARYKEFNIGESISLTVYDPMKVQPDSPFELIGEGVRKSFILAASENKVYFTPKNIAGDNITSFSSVSLKISSTEVQEIILLHHDKVKNCYSNNFNLPTAGLYNFEIHCNDQVIDEGKRTAVWPLKDNVPSDKSILDAAEEVKIGDNVSIELIAKNKENEVISFLDLSKLQVKVLSPHGYESFVDMQIDYLKNGGYLGKFTAEIAGDNILSIIYDNKLILPERHIKVRTA